MIKLAAAPAALPGDDVVSSRTAIRNEMKLTLLSLVAAHRIVGVDGTLSLLIQTAKDSRNIVWEEPLSV